MKKPFELTIKLRYLTDENATPESEHIFWQYELANSITAGRLVTQGNISIEEKE